MVANVYDQNMSTVAFWSLATPPGHVGIQRGKVMWHKIQPGPIRFSTWAYPFMIFFLLILVSYIGLAQQFRLLFSRTWPSVIHFFFGPQPFYNPIYFGPPQHTFRSLTSQGQLFQLDISACTHVSKPFYFFRQPQPQSR